VISVIIPSHNEEALIGRSLAALTCGEGSDPLQIIVVCNGCTDRTADVARAFGPAVTVLETPVPSKVHALNLGDQAATGFPRFYMDADVQVTARDVCKVADALHKGPCLAAAPRLRMDCSESSWLVRAYYRAWLRLPYCREGMMGVGVYAVSEQGRKRFLAFPDIIADDLFVRLQFTPEERTAVEDTWSVVQAPRTIRGLIKIKSRGRLGNFQLRLHYPHLFKNDPRAYHSAYGPLLKDPRRWPDLMVYLAVTGLASIRAKRQIKRLSAYRWERDESARTAGQVSTQS
jgi:glycosyltransferase involved in cell wall biosynthesis